MSQGREFFDLVKAIGESKSKQEEDRIISEEVAFLKKKIVETGIPKKKVKEFLVRAIYVEMLGQDASYAYIRAVELCASTNIAQKRTGYLFSTLCFSPTHEFRFMLVNQMQRDMNSSNHLEVCAALVAVCKLLTEDMIPAIQGEIVKLLKHDMDIVRKRAVCALHRCFQLDKHCMEEHMDKIRRVLCDKDPSVMGASLPMLYEIISEDPAQHKDLVSSFVSILKQITEHRLPRDFDYHRIPAPWIQIHLLRLMALLGRGDQASSEQMYEVIVDVMRRADTGINVGYAVVYEVVRTITTIYPNALLLDAAATSISRFIRSDSHNLKYIGIKGLAAIVKDHPKYAADHQMAVIDCLEDPDETLKRKTLDLLFRMTNSVNVEFIVEKLLNFLETSNDEHFRSDLVTRITQCAETFAPSNSWYVKTMIRIFVLAGDRVKANVTETLMQLVAEGATDDDGEEGGEDLSEDLRTGAVEDFLVLIEKGQLPAILAQTISWVLGEYGHLSTTNDKNTVMLKLVNLAYQTNDTVTRACVITALLKLVAQSGGECPEEVVTLVNEYSISASIDVQQRCLEFNALLRQPELLVNVLPVDASLEDIEVDSSLSFLDHYVQAALNDGAVPYSPPACDDDDDDIAANTGGLKITPYAMPVMPPAGTVNVNSTADPTQETPVAKVGIVLGGGAQNSVESITSASGMNLTANTNTIVGIKSATSGNIWGKKMEPVEPPTPAPAASAVTDSNMDDMMSGMTLSGGPGAAPASNVNMPPTPPVPAEPEKPRELTQKEKMAAAMFMGIGGPAPKANTGSGGGISSRRRTASPPPSNLPVAALSPPAAPPASVGDDDMFSGMSVGGAAPPVPVSSSGGAGLFDGMDVGSAAPPAAPAPSGGGMFDGMDIGGAPAAPVSKPVDNTLDIFAEMSAAPAYQNPTSHNNMSQFDSPGGSSSPPPPIPAPSGPPAVTPIVMNTAQFGGKWGQLQHEVKNSLPCAAGIRTLELLRSTLTTNTYQAGGGDVFAMGPTVGAFHHIESIAPTNEAIFSCAPGDKPNEMVLIHVKLIPARNKCDVIVKGTSREACMTGMTELCSPNRLAKN